MSKKKSESGNQVRVGKISGTGGDVNVAGGNITTHHTTGLSAAELKQLFDGLYSTIETRPEIPASTKAGLKAEVEELQSGVTEAAGKQEKVDESFVYRRFRNIARMAPDILDVVVATLVNPLAGLGVAAKKIADKAKEEAA